MADDSGDNWTSDVDTDELLTMQSVSYRSFGDLWGLQGLQVGTGEDFDIKEAHAMLTRDATVAAGWAILRLVLLGHIGEYTHPDGDIQEFVNAELENIDGYEQSIEAMLTAPIYGFSALERIWERDGDTWHIERLKPIHPLSLRGGFRTDDHGTLTQIVQEPAVGAEIKLAPEKVVLWSFGDTFGEYPEGHPLLAPAYRHFEAVKAILRLLHRTLEQGPRPLIAWPVQEGEMYNPRSGEYEPAVKVVTELGEDIDSRSIIAFETHEDVEGPEVLSTGNIKPNEFLDSLRYHEGNILKAMLVPRLLVEEPEHATRAQAETQYTGPFAQNVRGIQREHRRVLMEGIVRPLIDINIGDIDNYGTWRFEPIEPSEAEMWANVIQKLTRAGIRLTAEDRKQIREQFPDVLGEEPTVEDVERSNDSDLPDYSQPRP